MDEIDYLDDDSFDASKRLEEPVHENRVGFGVGTSLAVVVAAYNTLTSESKGILPYPEKARL